MRIWKIAAIAAAMAVGGGFVAVRTARGAAFRDRLYTNRHCCDLSLVAALNASIHEARGAVFPSQIGQDKWVLFRVFPGLHDGYFVDVGSADGTINRTQRRSKSAVGRASASIPSPPTCRAARAR